LQQLPKHGGHDAKADEKGNQQYGINFFQPDNSAGDIPAFLGLFSLQHKPFGFDNQAAEESTASQTTAVRQ
jgi:hypothetical protein